MDTKDEKDKEQIEEKSDEKERVESEKLDTDLEQLKKDVNEWQDKYKRALADYQNLQRYTQQQRILWAQQASRDIILKLLPVLDTLMLTAKHFEDKSLPLAIEQFLKVLEEEGVKKIKTVGEKFDPNAMECITTKAIDSSAGSEQEGKVLEEVRAGYTLGEAIIRTAQVIVGK